MNVLYISYDGLLEPLGQSQVLPYLEGLSRSHRFVLVTYEKRADWANVETRERLQRTVREMGIRWVPLTYHKRPTAPATAYDVLAGIAICSYLVVQARIEIVHARSYVSALIALGVRKGLKIPFVFDMRGFWADEKVEAGSWRQESRLYRGTKWFEKRFLLDADAVVSLTHAAVEVMQSFPYLQDVRPHFEVITTCTNLERFQPAPKPESVPGAFLLGYVGAVGAWDVFDEVVRCFLALRAVRPQARLLVVNRGGHDYVRACLARQDVPLDLVEIRSVEYAEVPRFIHRMDAGIFFYKPGYSRAATAPTKLGEFLACGIPCLTGAGVGDVDSILEQERVGVVLREATDASRRDAIAQLLQLTETPETRHRCVDAAGRLFSLAAGVQSYDALYRSIVPRGR